MTARQDRSEKDNIAAYEVAARLYGDPRFQELGTTCEVTIRKAAHLGMQSFRAAGYEPDEAAVAIAFALTRTLASLERAMAITPDDLGRLVAEALIKERERNPT
jgi:hypothetical protein